jgi:phospholipid transport system substrate-binding protein
MISTTPISSPKKAASVAAVAALLGAVVLAFAGLADAVEDGPTVVVQQTTRAVVGVLSQHDLPTDEKRRRIEQIVYGSIDFDTLARLVLARNWSRLTPEQQTQFTAEFRKHLSVTYARNIEGYKNEKVQVVGDREETRGDWTVKTHIVREAAQPIEVDYRLRSRDGTWRIIDVIIEGVSLVSNFRSQFQSIVANEGPARLLDLLREKNAKGEPLKS